MISTDNITGLILAGGRGSRMGGIDKGLQHFKGQALAYRALQRLRPQVHICMINANRNIEQYQAFGIPTHPDVLPDFAGPLSGFLTGLTHCTTEWLLTVPCDCPCFPSDLAARMASTAAQNNAQITLAAAPETTEKRQVVIRPQPVFALLHRSLLSSLQTYLAKGGRKIDQWSQLHTHALCHFNLPQDNRNAFANVNTLQDLQMLENSAP